MKLYAYQLASSHGTFDLGLGRYKDGNIKGLTKAENKLAVLEDHQDRALKAKLLQDLMEAGKAEPRGGQFFKPYINNVPQQAVWGKNYSDALKTFTKHMLEPKYRTGISIKLIPMK